MWRCIKAWLPYCNVGHLWGFIWVLELLARLIESLLSLYRSLTSPSAFLACADPEFRFPEHCSQAWSLMAGEQPVIQAKKMADVNWGGCKSLNIESILGSYCFLAFMYFCFKCQCFKNLLLYCFFNVIFSWSHVLLLLLLFHSSELSILKWFFICPLSFFLFCASFLLSLLITLQDHQRLERHRMFKKKKDIGCLSVYIFLFFGCIWRGWIHLIF